MRGTDPETHGTATLGIEEPSARQMCLRAADHVKATVATVSVSLPKLC